MNFKNKSKLSYIFLRVVSKVMELDKKTRYYGTDQPLYEAEIHMIKAIKENEGIHVTGLAEILGVTKGAVSQIIMRLEKKGMITKDTDPRNLSRLMLSLTDKGETAYRYHEEMHLQFEELFGELLSESTPENQEFLRKFLSSLDEKMSENETK